MRNEMEMKIKFNHQDQKSQDSLRTGYCFFALSSSSFDDPHRFTSGWIKHPASQKSKDQTVVVVILPKTTINY
ncbi:hypothetical protein DERP_000602 [Dermatophagoides pteronyssinus]|uniref:Uncharacterized protein n=1 Tax=Dermatophagoides pteronyssinus TaxID=6956 RepID=A0ABQ8J0L7_DERPT|nr:hypothetical protein DERP_000602 [Dermatophagoides pteronyssinus]